MASRSGSTRSAGPPYAMMGALAHTMLIGGIARGAIPVLSTFVISDLDLTTTQFGASVTAMSGSVVLGVTIMGSLADRFGARRVLTVRALGVAMALAGIAVAPSFGWLVLGQAAMGLLVSGGVPSTNKLVAQYVPVAHQGLVLGAKQAGAQAGALISGLLLPSIAVRFGWEWGAVAAAGIVLSTLITLYPMVPGDGTRAERRAVVQRSWRHLSASRSVRWLVVHGFLTGAGIAMIFSYLPLYGNRRLGLSPSAAGALVSVMSAVGVVARIVWGRRAMPENLRRNLMLMSMASIAATGLIAAASLGVPWLIWFGALLAGWSMEAWNPVGMLGVIHSVSTGDAARASSIVMLGFMGGSAVSPYVFSLVVESTGSFAWGWALCGIVFVVGSIMRYPRDTTGGDDDAPLPA